jgi:hypothetical protein
MVHTRLLLLAMSGFHFPSSSRTHLGNQKSMSRRVSWGTFIWCTQHHLGGLYIGKLPISKWVFSLLVILSYIWVLTFRLENVADWWHLLHLWEEKKGSKTVLLGLPLWDNSGETQMSPVRPIQGVTPLVLINFHSK